MLNLFHAASAETITHHRDWQKQTDPARSEQLGESNEIAG